MMESMDERELAESIEGMRDDPEAWGEPSEEQSSRPPKSEKRQRGVVVSVRLTPDELTLVQAKALSRSMSVSGYLRQAGLEGGTELAGSCSWGASPSVGRLVVVNTSRTDERLLVRGVGYDTDHVFQWSSAVV